MQRGRKASLVNWAGKKKTSAVVTKALCFHLVSASRTVHFLLSTEPFQMATKNIAVNANVFPCPDNWTVDQAKAEIRCAYGLQFGYLQADGVPLLGIRLIGDIVGALSFTGGQPIQQGKTVTSRHVFPNNIPSPLSPFYLFNLLTTAMTYFPAGDSDTLSRFVYHTLFYNYLHLTNTAVMICWVCNFFALFIDVLRFISV